MTKISKRGFMEGRPKKFTDPDVMSEKIDNYFSSCDDKKDEPYTVTGLCLYLGMDRVTLLDYEADPMFSSAIKRAKQRVENYTEKRALLGKANPTFAIFSLKNNFGWKDKTEVETNDVSKQKYETWLKENEDLVNVTPETKEIEE